MFIKENDVELTISKNMFDRYNMGDTAFFDIETTGFDKEKDNIILISFGHFEGENYSIKQYFAEDIEQEGDIIESFTKDLYEYDRWCSYNGKAFDEPFIKHRMELNNINLKLPKKHVDLYRLIKPYYKQLGLERCNLKTVEKYIGVKRSDKIDGGISVQLYYNYLERRENKIRDVILLHNYEDVLNLPKIFNIVYEIENNPNLIRNDCITQRQLSYLKSLINKNNITLDMNIEKLSKKEASKVIDSILKGKKIDRC